MKSWGKNERPSTAMKMSSNQDPSQKSHEVMFSRKISRDF